MSAALTDPSDSAARQPAHHESLMRRVLELANTAIDSGKGLPYGAVIARGGEVIADAHNEVRALVDPTAHAELLAVRRASAALGQLDLSGCVLYTNAAPCCMCMSAALWAKLDELLFVVGMDASASVGLGDAHYYAELARPHTERQIMRVRQLPTFHDEALATISRWQGMEREG